MSYINLVVAVFFGDFPLSPSFSPTTGAACVGLSSSLTYWTVIDERILHRPILARIADYIFAIIASHLRQDSRFKCS